ncbi:MAG TPA: MerR family transcriptional regulator [Egibacteraceae bacterium]|nr:MerR family transcriptional regulator [Egibacteraceae bacterium]
MTPPTRLPSAPPAAHDGPPPAPADARPGYTVDQLAALTGVPSRTIRHYQSEKVLPPPDKQGRIALYRELHVRRLELIAQLQDRGLSLKAIREALRDAEQGRLSLEDWLGLSDQIRQPWSDDAPALLRHDELATRLAGRRPGLLAELAEAGLVKEQAGLPPTYLVPSPGLLDVALRLEAAGVELRLAGGAAAVMRKHVRRAADDLVAHFLRHGAEGLGKDAASTGEALDALRQLSAEAMRLIFAREVERALRERRDDLAAALSRARRDGS